MRSYSRFFGLISVACLYGLTAPVISYSEEEFDRLDGTGKSGKKVNVIEWEGNLEVHVYPAQSLKGLALKIDRTKKKAPVMVISYRFDGGKPIIRRNILSIDLRDGFHTYKDPSADEYDKIVITNNELGTEMAAFKLDPEPKQLYPDGHPALLAQEEATDSSKRAPAAKPHAEPNAIVNSEDPYAGSLAPDEEGTIQPFYMKQAKKPRKSDAGSNP